MKLPKPRKQFDETYYQDRFDDSVVNAFVVFGCIVLAGIVIVFAGVFVRR